MIGRRSCVLKSLENSILNGILFGLSIEEQKLLPQQSMFPCCRGEGILDDYANNTLIRCGLTKRLKRTQIIVDQYFKSWPKNSDGLICNPSSSARILRQVSDTIKGYRPQGSVVAGKPGVTSEFWHMALACTWRFGISSHVVSLNQVNPKNLFPGSPSTTGPMAIFIEQVHKLWDVKQVENLEALVTYAYHTNSFLWIEFCHQPQNANQKAGITFQEKMTHKISNMKNKSPYEFLDKDCVSRLKSLCTLPRTTMEGIEE